MPPNTLISVITPTFNRAHLIERAIRSVQAQTYTNWEHIIVDDASTDNTKEVVSKFPDERIRYIGYDKNGGNAVARNVGVKEAKGEFIAFLDSDDEYLPTYLEKALKQINAEPSASFLWSGTRTVAGDGSHTESIWVPKLNNYPNQFLYELHVGIGRGFLIKRKCFENIQFDERFRTAVDTDFLIRLRQRYDFTILEEVLLNIYTQPGSVRSNYTAKKNAYKILIDKHREIISQNKSLKVKFYYKLFWLAIYDADERLALWAFKGLPIFTRIQSKSLILWMVFKVQNKEKAIKFHKKFSLMYKNI